MLQKSLRHSCSSGVFLSWASRLAFLQETARIFTKASHRDANSAFFGRFQSFSAGWSNIYMLSGTRRSFQNGILRRRTGFSPFFGTPRGMPVWKVPSFRGFRASEKNLGSPLIGRPFINSLKINNLHAVFFSLRIILFSPIFANFPA